ncbi:YggT family protein [Dactylosporangium sp. NPDC049525]|uniref:YggT family protein n=1 Tax=Dactylosporangium sp. NPDC049525 TaxID=3154730 RepID=UPI00343C3D09
MSFCSAMLIRGLVLDWSVELAGPAPANSIRSRLSTSVRAVTEPIPAPVRRVVPPLWLGGVAIDLAFIVVFFAIVVPRCPDRLTRPGSPRGKLSSPRAPG